MTVTTLEPIAAGPEERATIARVEQLLARRSDCPAHLVGPEDETIALPEAAFRLLKEVIHQLNRGHAVAIVPVQMELTTQQAADLLNVSRQYLVRLLEQGKIPFHRTGTHRRIKFDDLMEYKRQRDAARREGLRRLTQLTEELGLYDE